MNRSQQVIRRRRLSREAEDQETKKALKTQCFLASISVKA
jgi:hypothetical protein